jgi:hypothetical protein
LFLHSYFLLHKRRRMYQCSLSTSLSVCREAVMATSTTNLYLVFVRHDMLFQVGARIRMSRH